MASNKGLMDEFSKLMTDAAGVADGLRREASSAFKTQVDRVLRDADVVSREEFEAVREMAAIARDENEALRARLDALEARLGGDKGASAHASSSPRTAPTGPDLPADAGPNTSTTAGGRSAFEAGL